MVNKLLSTYPRLRNYPLHCCHSSECPSTMSGIPPVPRHRPLRLVALNSFFKRALEVTASGMVGRVRSCFVFQYLQSHKIRVQRRFLEGHTQCPSFDSTQAQVMRIAASRCVRLGSGHQRPSQCLVVRNEGAISERHCGTGSETLQ